MKKFKFLFCGFILCALVPDQFGQPSSLNSAAVIDVKAPPYRAACNGSTDDTAAVQAAINAVAPLGGTIILDNCTLGSVIHFRAMAGKYLTMLVRHQLQTSATLPWPDFVEWKGEMGEGAQFQMGNRATIVPGPRAIPAILGTGSNAHRMTDLNVGLCPGTCIKLDGISKLGALYSLRNVAAQTAGTSGGTAVPLLDDSVFWVYCDRCYLLSHAADFPASFRITDSARSTGGAGLVELRDSIISTYGIQIDPQVSISDPQILLRIDNLTTESMKGSLIRFDSSHSSLGGFFLNNITMADSAWTTYNAGKVSVQNGSNVVTLSGGTFTNSVTASRFEVLGDRQTYGVKYVDATHITLDRSYAGNTARDAAYYIGAWILENISTSLTAYAVSNVSISDSDSLMGIPLSSFPIDGLHVSSGETISFNGWNLGTGFVQSKYTLLHGGSLYGDWTGNGTAMHPSLAPVASLPVRQDVAQWHSLTSATVAAGITAPDGTPTAARVTSSSGLRDLIVYEGLANSAIRVGDWIIAGVWARSENPQQATSVVGGQGPALEMPFYGTDQFNWGSNTLRLDGDQARQVGSRWTPIGAAGKITAYGGHDSIRVNLRIDPNFTMDYWMPWAIHIPAGTMSDDEVMRYALTLRNMPSSMPKGGGLIALYGHQALDFGPDTGIRRSAGGVLQVTNGAGGYGRLALDNTTPANSSTACTPQSIWADANYVYVCVANGNIKRARLTSW